LLKQLKVLCTHTKPEQLFKKCCKATLFKNLFWFIFHVRKMAVLIGQKQLKSALYLWAISMTEQDLFFTQEWGERDTITDAKNVIGRNHN
jgi:hypothetical protein